MPSSRKDSDRQAACSRPQRIRLRPPLRPSQLPTFRPPSKLQFWMELARSLCCSTAQALRREARCRQSTPRRSGSRTRRTESHLAPNSTPPPQHYSTAGVLGSRNGGKMGVTRGAIIRVRGEGETLSVSLWEGGKWGGNDIKEGLQGREGVGVLRRQAGDHLPAVASDCVARAISSGRGLCEQNARAVHVLTILIYMRIANSFIFNKCLPIHFM